MPARTRGGRGRSASASVLAWLLEEEEPAVRYLALRDLERRPARDPELRAAHAAIPTRGWAADILAARAADGTWAGGQDLYRPKYLATTWPMIVLADLGLTRDQAGIERSCERWMRAFPLRGGGVGGSATGTGHHCLVGNMVRALCQFGYADDARVRASVDWLVATADPKGGWSCFGHGRNLDSWEGLGAFAAYPRPLWTPEMATAVERAAEFFLERELHRQGARYAPWFRFHYPVHYYYDLLVGLDLLTSLGHAGDPRLATALEHLRRTRGPDGRWRLGPWHPDVEGPMAEWFRRHPKRAPTPVGWETPGRPSKMVTLRALRVLDRVERATAA